MSCIEKQEKLKEIFKPCLSSEQTYQKIIELGRSLPPLDISQKIASNLVHGCQSEMYLHTLYKDGCLHFTADSDALISKGLAALLIAVYSGEPPASLLSHPPTFLHDLGLLEALSPGRSNGLLSLHLRMKQEAVKYACLISSSV